MNDLTERVEASLRNHAERVNAAPDTRFVARLELAQLTARTPRPSRGFRIALLTTCLAMSAAVVVAIRALDTGDEDQAAPAVESSFDVPPTTGSPTASQPTASQPTASQPTASQPSVGPSTVNPEDLPLLPVLGDKPSDGEFGSFAWRSPPPVDVLRLVRPGRGGGAFETALITATRFPQAGLGFHWGDRTISGRPARVAGSSEEGSEVSLAGEPTVTFNGPAAMQLAEAWEQFGIAIIEADGQPSLRVGEAPGGWRVIGHNDNRSGVIAQLLVAGGIDIGGPQGVTINSSQFDPLLFDNGTASLVEVTVRGAVGWVSRAGDNHVSLTWKEQPGRFIEIWARSEERAIAAAEDLHFVDYESWLKRTGQGPPYVHHTDPSQPQLDRETIAAVRPKVAPNQPTIRGANGRTYGPPGSDMVGVLASYAPNADFIVGYAEPMALRADFPEEWPLYDTRGKQIATWHACLGALPLEFDRAAYPSCEELRTRFEIVDVPVTTMPA